MNILEKLKNYLARDGVDVVCGRPQTVGGTTLALSMGDGDDAENMLGDVGCISYQTLDVAVYADDYLQGYDLLLSVEQAITAAEKTTVKISFKRYCASSYDEKLGKHVLTSQYKIYE